MKLAAPAQKPYDRVMLVTVAAKRQDSEWERVTTGRFIATDLQAQYSTQSHTL